MEKSTKAKICESLVVITARTTHGVYHLFRKFHWRRHGFWISAQNVPKVYVEQMTCKITKTWS